MSAVATMRYAPSAGDLSILSAERYDAGIHFGGPSRRMTRRSTVEAQELPEDGPRKKAKTQAGAEKQTDEDEGKRSRGRPRLDTKDETAADRRRTQIRLAQRAYRNRKENAIQTLEKKVSELKEANEEMSNAFMQLHDFAIRHGLVERVPELARQLQTTTEKFLSLARRSSEDGKDDEHQNGSEPDSDGQAVASRSSHPRETSVEDVIVASSSSSVVPKATGWGGVLVAHEPVQANEPFTSVELVPSTMTTSFADASLTDNNFNFEIVTQPTLENASFPFSGIDFSFAQFNMTTPSPYPTLPQPPETYAETESTFGRRLMRTCIQRALTLITMIDPPKERFARVFGFCLLFETREAIRERLHRQIERSKEESLANWQYPFYNLGGAGTHFDSTAAGNNANGNGNTANNHSGSSSPTPRSNGGSPPPFRIGNQGTTELMKTKTSNGFGMGPFDNNVTEVRNTALDRRMRMTTVPGLSGDFLDCDEVEIYLHQRGISIPPGADYITAEVDANEFEEAGSTAAEVVANISSSGLHGLNVGAGVGTPADRSAGGASDPGSGWNVNNNTDPALLANSFLSGAPSSNDFGASTLLPTFPSISGMGRSDTSSPAPRKQIVTLDVNAMVFELTERATCLGRTPGLRSRDINASFWIASRTR